MTRLYYGHQILILSVNCLFSLGGMSAADDTKDEKT
jgi:hypothetical protein